MPPSYTLSNYRANSIHACIHEGMCARETERQRKHQFTSLPGPHWRANETLTREVSSLRSFSPTTRRAALGGLSPQRPRQGLTLISSHGNIRSNPSSAASRASQRS